jgi:syntaxin 1B/2/3
MLYQELATVVEQQDPVVEAAEDNAVQTNMNIEKGNEEVSKANEHAKRTRKLKWWCFFVAVLIVLAIALGVGLGVGLAKSATGN